MLGCDNYRIEKGTKFNLDRKESNMTKGQIRLS